MPDINNSKAGKAVGLVNRVLTQTARGYKRKTSIWDKLFPEVPVDTRKGEYPTFGKDMFAISEDKRAMTAQSNRGKSPFVALKPYQTTEYDHEIPLDENLIKESNEVKLYNLEKGTIKKCKDVVELNKDRRACALAQDASQYADSNKETKVDTFFDDSNVDWITYIAEKMWVVQRETGEFPTDLAWSGAAWSILRTTEQYKAYARKYPNDNLFATKKMLAAILSQDEDNFKLNIHIVNNFYADANTGKNINMWNNNLLLWYNGAPTGMDADEHNPNFGYTFSLKGYPYADDYFEKDIKSQVYRYTDQYVNKIVGADSAYLIKNIITPAKYAERIGA